MDDPFAPLVPVRATSDNAPYVALRLGGDLEGPFETTEADLAALDEAAAAAAAEGAGPATAGRGSRGATRSEEISPILDVASPAPSGRSPRERVHADPVASLLPPSVLATRVQSAEADDARSLGLPVPFEAGDSTGTIALKSRLAALHLKADDEGMHERALSTLDDVASGRVKAIHVTKEGGSVEVDLHPRFRASAAKAILASAMQASRQTGPKIEIGTANILAAGDVIAQVDPAKLRAARERFRNGRGSV